MKLRRVAVLGGGPGGLYVARLLKLAQPDCEVDLYEQGTAATTFGFGVGLAAGTQRNLRSADPDSLADILDRGHPHDMSLRVGDAVAHMPDDTLRAIARSTLLEVLTDHARAAGVTLHLGRRVVAAELDADLVIAADGINSATRDAPGTDFGTEIEVGEGLYLWCGTDFALPSALFMPVTTAAGTFVTHAYPYAGDRSTFLVETDEQTWKAAGFDVTTDALATAAPDASDEVALRYLEQAFAAPLQGHPLIGNRTRWLRFRTVRCARWHQGHVVLLGDAAHTAHYSIGSGTKLAMEDAIALVAAIGAHDNVPDALAEYEAVRRPAVEHLQDVAGRSQRWWDTFPDRLDVPVNQLLVAYMTRAGKVPLPRFAESTPEVVRAALAEFARGPVPDDVLDDLEEFVLTRPGRRGAVAFDDRITPLPAESTVRLDGPGDRDTVLDRLDLADRLRTHSALPVTVVGPEACLPDLVAGLVAGRTDLIEVTPARMSTVRDDAVATARDDVRLPPFDPGRAARYRAEGVWGDATVADEFHRSALTFPDCQAVVAAEGALTYRELDDRTDRLAAGLLELGLRPGDPVLFQVDNRLSTVVAWYAVLKAGLVPVATLSLHRRHEISEIAARTGAVAHLVGVDDADRFDLAAFGEQFRAGHPTLRHLLTLGTTTRDLPGVPFEGLAVDDADLARRVVEDVQRALDPDGVVVFQLSGGTTGVPKVIPRRHAEYWYNSRAYADRLGWDADSRVAHLIPIIHNAGIVCGLHAPHSVGACLVLGVPDAAASVPLLVQERVTDVLIGHGHFQAIAGRAMPELAPTLQRAILSGAKIPPRLFDAIEAQDVWVGQLFGMAEGFFGVSELAASREARLTTVGTKLSPLDEFRILDPGTETEVPDGVTGELCCRGPYTLPGYFDAAEHNAVAFTSDGFYRTGDLATVRMFDGERCLSIDGRIKDVINRGGEKVNAEEVELLLLQHAGIEQAAVVAMPDPRLGERACAFLVATGEVLTLEDVRQHLGDLGVAKYKWPERLEWVAELPRSKVNKVDKKALRERAAHLEVQQSGGRGRPSG